jgi:hypothetical protein
MNNCHIFRLPRQGREKWHINNITPAVQPDGMGIFNCRSNNRPSNILQKYYQKDFSPLMSKKDIEVKRDERIL